MLHRIFYFLKPAIPRSIQILFRRRLLELKLQKFKDTWPILLGSERKPDNWKGWPDGKQFLLVLTHDVEHQRGYDRALKLMQIEKNLGLVSSFNFVPERDYKVNSNLLKTLKQNGFEYGVHGLKHDGRLFLSEDEFLKRAPKINSYLQDWGAVGFRAPAMHHNLDWIGALNIEYDLSTFDTDPFEPQPDGVGTIFPFWVSNKRHPEGGYVELPYTLPQDFTLFIIMKEKSPSIWQKKINWIAENGGMALLNIHPDYINFENGFSNEEYPISIYESFLADFIDKFYGRFWNPLPQEAARYIKDMYSKKEQNLPGDYEKNRI